MTVAWLLLAAALHLAGSGRRARADRDARSHRPVSLRSLQCGAAVAVAVGCAVAVGLVRGVLIAAVAAPASAVAVTRLYRRPPRTRASPSLALALDLVAVALTAGQPLSAALVLAAPAAGAPADAQLARVGALLRLGADPDEAWRTTADDPVLEPVAAAARRSAASGIRLAAAFEQLATELRAQLRTAATARAERAGVLAAAPLGLCFLPSFVCLGIVPVVVGIAGGVLAGTG